MPEQHGLGREGHRLPYDIVVGQGAKFSVDEANFVTVVEQWPTDRKQPQRRQMVRNTAADRRMMHVDQ